MNTEEFKPVDFFKQTFPDDFIESVTTETNRYFHQFQSKPENTDNATLKQWYNVTADEMKAFLAILILVDLDDMGSFRVHWTTDPLLEKPSGFRRIMSRNRFQMILRFLHVVDNSQQVPRGQQGYDHQFKIRNMIEKLVIAWNTCFQMEKELSVDVCCGFQRSC